jgi:phage host-nuclease inhibitor protein Gam
MSKPTKNRIKQGPLGYAVPNTAEEVSTLIAELGTLNRELFRIEANMGDEMAAVKEKHEAIAQGVRQQIEWHSAGVQTWCEAHRPELLKGDAKTAQFPSGEVQWRVRPPSVRISGVDAVMDLLRRKGLERFLRTKEEINKEAILAEPAAVAKVPGIRIDQAEDFVIKPFEAPLMVAE